MQNYVQGEIISPTGKFEALQTSDGHALLFAIDTTGVFHVIEEESGISHTGWKVNDLSTATIKAKFPGQQSSAAVVTAFDVGQSIVDGSIGLMMAVSLDGNDHLFMSLGNSNQDTSWIAHPTWTMVPFDAANEQPQNITVTGALFAETQDKQQYLVVDIDRPLGNKGDEHIARYHIDPTRQSSHYWVKHDVTVDIASAKYQSVVGRVSRKPVDGIYTAGTTGGQPQLVYEPILNYYGHGPVTPRRLRLPNGAIPSAIATARNADGSSDLYAIGGSTLYRFPADKQEEDIDPETLIASEYLSGTDTLRAMFHDGVTTLWGRNMSDQVYYSACSVGQLANPDAWSPPLPILSNIERISPYVNRADGGNTIFAFGNGRLQKLIQGSAAIGNVWRAQEITLATPSERKPISFMSYTTSILVTQQDNNLPAPNAMTKLSANSRTPVYINGVYYVLSEIPIQVATDATGSLTVVEATDDLTGAILTVSLDNIALTINPMDHNFSKIAALDSPDKLRSAQAPSQIVAGGIVGSTEQIPLVAPSVSSTDLEAVAQTMALMKEAYIGAHFKDIVKEVFDSTHSLGKLPSRGSSAGRPRVVKFGVVGHLKDAWNDLRHGRIGDAADDLGDAVEAAWGDAKQWVKNNAEALGGVFLDEATKTLHFYLQIGEKIYHSVLDTVHAIVGAAEWVFDKIKTALQTLWNYLQTLLHWDDIRSTKNVMHNIIKLWLQNQVDNIPRARQALDSTIDKVEKEVNEWANINNWSPGLGDAAKKPVTGGDSDPSQSLTPSSKFLSDKYRDHAKELKILGNVPTMDVVENLLNKLITEIAKEGQVLEAIFNQLQDLASKFRSLSVEEILQKIAAIIVDGTLSSLQVVVDTLLDVLHGLAQSALSVLDTKIHIPVISDILNKIGVPDISFLDLLTWIAAVAVTISFKIAEGYYPFPVKDVTVQTLVSASSWDEAVAVFAQLEHLSSSTQKAVFEGCHMCGGILTLVGNFVTALEAEDQTGSNVIGIPAAVLGLSCAAINAAGDELVPMYPVQSEPFKILSMITTSAVIGCKVVFSGLGQKAFKAMHISKMVVEEARGYGAMLNAVLVLHGSAVTIWHFYELAKESGNRKKQAAAITGEVSNVASYISRVAYAFAVNDEEQESRLVAIAVMGVANWACGGLQLTRAGVGASAI